MQDTWTAMITVTPVPFQGSREDCAYWTDNLMGCEIRIVGKDGRDWVVGIASHSESTNVSAKWPLR
jgi:hypothetical protein